MLLLSRSAAGSSMRERPQTWQENTLDSLGARGSESKVAAPFLVRCCVMKRSRRLVALLFGILFAADAFAAGWRSAGDVTAVQRLPNGVEVKAGAVTMRAVALAPGVV